MRPIRTRGLDNQLIMKNSTTNVGDSLSSLGGVSVDKQLGNGVDYEDTFRVNDEEFDIDTQVMDNDVETQPIDLGDETQVMELSGNTQVMHDDCVEHMDTQLLDISDDEGCEYTSRKGVERADVELQVGVERMLDCRRQDGGQRLESMPWDDDAQNSGSVKRGLASVAAHQIAAHNADDGSPEFHPFVDYGSKSNVETVGGENDMDNTEEEGFSDGDKNNIARSLARKLFMEDDVAEIESDDNISDRREGLSRLFSFDDDVAGLSYVDSQEPGELSQANALEFVDRFLKVNVLESDESVLRKKAVADVVTPGAIVKGAQSIAQQASRKSTLAEASIYEWDVNLEDEGGGDFFIKKKEVLYGTPKSCPKPHSSRPQKVKGSQSLGKLQNEKKNQNLWNTTTGFSHSDFKSSNVRGKGKVKQKVTDKKAYDCPDHYIDLGSSSQEAFASVHKAQSVDMHNVGIDTQMAAEAMEALSAVTALVNNDISMDGRGCHTERDQSRKEAKRNGPSKQRSLQKRVWLSTPGVVTRSRSKRAVKTRGQSAMGKFDVDFLYSKAKQKRRLSMNNFSAVKRRETCDIGPMKVDGKQTKSILEGQLNNNPPLPSKRRSLRGKDSTFTPVVQQVVQCIERNPCDADEVPGGKQHTLEVVHKRKCRKRSNLASETLNHNNETVNQITAANFDNSDGSNCKTGDIQHTSNQETRSRDEEYKFNADKSPEFAIESIARRTRSRLSTTQFAECPLDKRDLFSHGMLSSEDSHQLSSKKQDASSPPATGILGSGTVDESPGSLQKPSNPAYVTPDNIKTSRSAVSPICVGDGYHTPTCRKSLSLQKEISSLVSSEQRCSSPFKGLRQRRDMNNVRVLFSKHMDDDTIRQQKKILSRIGVSVASSILEATHFVADKFVRTRNMLEAIAYAKPVVTHSWIESCGQANCFIDEKNFILRDAKKEKELGFSMPRSLAHASRYPLLEGKRVLITPNAKPGKEVISCLVKAVHGQAIERLGRSIPNKDNLLVVSCEEDFAVCVPLLEKGIAVYSSELLLNGIITQRLEYERYRLFVGHVKKTRSTLWLKQDGEQFRPVTKTK